MKEYWECRDTGNAGIQEMQGYWECRDTGNA